MRQDPRVTFAVMEWRAVRGIKERLATDPHSVTGDEMALWREVSDLNLGLTE